MPTQAEIEAAARAICNVKNCVWDNHDIWNTIEASSQDWYLRLGKVALEAAERARWQPKWRHKKRGSIYEEVGLAEVQAEGQIYEGAILMIYRAKDGKLWARPEQQFCDGRFEAIPSPSEKA